MDDGRSVEVETPKRRIGARLYALLKSRLRWKERAVGLRDTIKSQEIEVRDVRASREKWKSDAREARRRIRELEKEAAQLREQLTAPKKSS
jgi:septal ring factor EnvC (AmiA/AmiB activator)